jgi:hypothetical protein
MKKKKKKKISSIQVMGSWKSHPPPLPSLSPRNLVSLYLLLDAFN